MNKLARNCAPWDEESIGSRLTGNCLVAFVWLFLACVIGCVALFFLIRSIEGIVASDTYPDAPLNPFVTLVIGVALCYAAWRALRRMSTAVELRRAYCLGDNSGHDESHMTVVLIPVVAPLSLKGTVTARFDDDSLYLMGQIGVAKSLYEASALPMMVISMYIGARYEDDKLMGGILLGLSWAALTLLAYLYYRLYCGKIEPGMPLRIQRQHVRKVRCLGPFVRLRLLGSLPRGLSTVYIFVPPNHRLSFFREFDGGFPGSLPQSYRDAVASASERIPA